MSLYRSTRDPLRPLASQVGRVYRDIARRPEERGEADYPTFAAGHAGLIVHEAIMESVTQKRWADVDWGAFAL